MLLGVLRGIGYLIGYSILGCLGAMAAFTCCILMAYSAKLIWDCLTILF